VHLAILTQYYPPEIGAPQARLSELARRFVERGHQVTVLTAMPNYPRGQIYSGYGGLFRRERNQGVEVIRTYVYPTKSVARVRRLANYFSFVLSSAVAGAAVLRGVDYLLTESPPLFLGMSGYLLSRFKRARWIFNVSDLWPESAVRLGIIGEGPALRASWGLEAFCYKQAWLVSGQSREILQDINARFPRSKTYHLSNGVDTTVFRPDRRAPALRAHLANGHDCVAIYAGLHGLAQGLDQVLAAAARLRDVRELGIVLVGDGPEKERLEAQAREQALANVRFLPPLPREQMADAMASADIALVPLKEYLPGAVPSKLYEGMGAGLPVVLVAQGEASHLVAEAEAGVVVAPGDIEGLARTLRELTRDPGRRRALGERGRQAAVERFDRRAIADAFIDRLEQELA
jgi:glycosyltransferase involved in cell wall biosynthesis